MTKHFDIPRPIAQHELDHIPLDDFMEDTEPHFYGLLWKIVLIGTGVFFWAITVEQAFIYFK